MIYFPLLTLGVFCSFSSCSWCRVSLSIWCFSCFLTYDYIAIYFPFRTAFAESHRFWVIMFSLLFVSRNLLTSFLISSIVQFDHSLVSNSLRSHGLQHARPPCPSPTPRVYSDSCPLSQWCHPTILSSVAPFSSCLQSFPASGSFQMSQFFTSGGQSIGVSALASVPPMNIQDWSPLGWTGWISLQSKGLLKSSPTPQFKSINSSVLNFLYGPTLTSITWLLEKP